MANLATLFHPNIILLRIQPTTCTRRESRAWIQTSGTEKILNSKEPIDLAEIISDCKEKTLPEMIWYFEEGSSTTSYGYGLFMRFCDSHHEVTQMQQEEKQ